MLRLPKALPTPLQLPKLGSEVYDLEALKSKPFSIIYIAGAISTGCTAADLRKYLQAFDRAEVEDKLSSTRRIVNHLVLSMPHGTITSTFWSFFSSMAPIQT